VVTRNYFGYSLKLLDMQKRFKDESTRLKNWDYGSRGSYFITACTKDRVWYFGKIVNGEMILSGSGQIAVQLWQEIPKKFPYAKIDSFVVMPNHIHGIISIVKPWESSDDFEVRKQKYRLETDIDGCLIGGVTGYKNPMLNENVSRIIRWFKGRCSFEIHKISADFGWQSRFHDRVIRSKHSYFRIKRYIENNVSNWGKNKMGY